MSMVIGGYGFDVVKFIILLSLEFGCSIFGGIISRVGKDVILCFGIDFGRVDVEIIFEWSFENLYRIMIQIVFWIIISFYMMGIMFVMIFEIFQFFLLILDQFFGLIDLLWVMVSIIILICCEFQNFVMGRQGEKVGVIDLMLGLCGMVYLQRWCWCLLEEESCILRVEEVVWDVVVLSDGVWVDVYEGSLYGVYSGLYVVEEVLLKEIVIVINSNGEFNDDD